jgi:primase-polymerase (primpol)-like protein
VTDHERDHDPPHATPGESGALRLDKAGPDSTAASHNGGTDHRFELPDNPAVIRLKSRKQWVAWKYVKRNGSSKPTKPPVDPHTGRVASVDDPATWGTYEQALACTRRLNLAGIGYVLTDDDDLTGFDLDNVRNPVTGAIEAWAAKITGFAESYTEISPSGTGLRIFAEGKVDHPTKVEAASVEIYGTGRYLTLTGQHVPNTPLEIRPAPETLAALYERVDAMRPAPTPRPPRDPNAEQTVWQEINT